VQCWWSTVCIQTTYNEQQNGEAGKKKVVGGRLIDAFKRFQTIACEFHTQESSDRRIVLLVIKRG
jgi:hypothetical protein